QFCRKLAAERPLKDIRDEYNYPKKKGIKDECSRLLEASTMKSRRGFAIQRLMNAMRQAHADGWFIVFDTLTLADDRLEAFYDNPNALRDYRQIRANTISFTVFPEIVPSIGNSFINTMKNINHTRSSISDDIRNILCSSANMRRAIPLILRLLMN